MKKIINGCRAEWYAAWHSRLWLWHIMISLLGILLFCGYYSYSAAKELNKIINFFVAVAFAFPFLSALMTAISYESEKEAGKCQRILSVPYSRWIGHFCRLAMLLLLGFMSVVITIMGFGIVMRIMGYKSYPLQGYFGIAIVLILTEIGIYVIQYIISFIWGKGIALGLGVMGSLVSALMQTGLGEGIWQYIPYAWGLRMVQYKAMLDVMTAHRSLMEDEMKKGSSMALLVTGMLLILFLFWSSRWQGSRQVGE